MSPGHLHPLVTLPTLQQDIIHHWEMANKITPSVKTSLIFFIILSQGSFSVLRMSKCNEEDWSGGA